MAGSALVGARALAGTNPVTVTLQQQSATPNTLDSTFNGFSYEKVDCTGPTLSSSNTSLVELMKLLGPGVVRLGGSSVDQIVWNENGGLTPNGFKLTGADIDRLASLMHATGWKLIYTLSLKIGAPPYNVAEPTEAQIDAAAEAAAQEAAYVYSSVGENLLGFEIGNEPDLMNSNGLRPSSYKFDNYKTEWQAFESAILSKAPGASFVGPGASSMYDDFLQTFVPILGSRVVLVTDHFYAGTGSESDALQQLLTNTGAYRQNHTYLWNYMLPTVHSLTAAVPIGYRIDESNAFGHANAPGFAFGTALWAIDYEFLAAANHASGMNFHNNYPPVSTNNSLGSVTAVNPLFYGMKLFSMAAKGTLLKATASAQQTTFSTYAVSANDGSTYVILNNKDPNNAVRASILFLQPAATATSMLLTAPSLNSTGGIQLGGATIGIDGSWPSPASEPVAVSNGSATATVPAGSAMFIHASPVTSSIQFAGLCAASMQNTASGPFLLEEERCNATSPGQQFAFVPSPDGFFYMVPENSALCLDWRAANSNVLQTSCSQSATQKWKVATGPGNGSSIQSGNGQYCFNVKGGPAVGASIVTSPCNGQSSEDVELSDRPRPPLQTTSTPIQASYDGQCIDVAADTTSAGPYIRQHGCNQSSSQSWAFSSTIDGYYTVRSNGSQLCLDGSIVNSAVQQKSCSGVGSQTWNLARNADKTYTITSVGSQWCFAIENESSAADTPLIVSRCNGGANQKFTFITAPPLLTQE